MLGSIARSINASGSKIELKKNKEIERYSDRNWAVCNGNHGNSLTSYFRLIDQSRICRSRYEEL